MTDGLVHGAVQASVLLCKTWSSVINFRSGSQHDTRLCNVSFRTSALLLSFATKYTNIIIIIVSSKSPPSLSPSQPPSLKLRPKYSCAVEKSIIVKSAQIYFSNSLNVPGWSSLGTWLGQPRRKTITVSSPLHWDRQLTGGDPWGVQEAPGWERSMTMFSPRTLESIQRGGRQGTGRSGNKSSVRQRSVRSMLPRRRRRIHLTV